MCRQLAQRLKKSFGLLCDIESPTDVLVQILSYSSTSHWFVLILSMPVQFGPLAHIMLRLKTSMQLRVCKPLHVQWPLVTGAPAIMHELLSLTELPTLERRRLELKLY